MKEILKKIIIGIFVLLVLILFYTILFKTNQSFILKRETININKLLVIVIDCIFIVVFTFIINKKDISKKKYYIILSIIQIVLIITQIIILLNIRFNTGWDVQDVKNAVDTFISKGSINNNEYLTKYPNNLLLVGILSLLRKIPIIGKYYLTTLLFNTILVNIAILLISLSLKNIHSYKSGILVYIFTIPLIALNPWFTIPYSDTFALFFVSLITYLYSKKEKNNLDLFFIIFISIFGAYIKPTIVIPLISIIICELIFIKKQILKKDYKKYIIVVLAIIGSLLLKEGITSSINFTPVKNKHAMTVYHYLSMGQNINNFGFYNLEDENVSYIYGPKADKEIFKKRIKKNIGKNQINLIINKTAISFYDGSFAWGSYAAFFPKNRTIENPKGILKNIYYKNGKYYNLYLNISTYIWFCILLFMPFVLLKKINKDELFLLTTFIGIFLFLIIFEPYSRYVYCFSGIIITISFLGIYRIYDYLKRIYIEKNKQKSNKNKKTKKA